MKEPSSIKDEFEYWRWLEYNRVIPGKKWTSKDVITAGVDVETSSAKGRNNRGIARAEEIIRTLVQ